jgi:DNA gyrase subunit A
MMVVTVSRDGYVKRTSLETYRTQARGGRGIIGSETKEGDAIRSLFVAGTHDYLLCFSNRGQVYWLKVYTIPEASRTSAGRAINNLIEMQAGERITNVLRVPSFDEQSFVFFATLRGTVKKTALSAFSRPKKGGIRAILLEENDEVVGVGVCKSGDTIVLGTAHGQAIRFDEKAARSMGRTSYGVRGIRLLRDDRVVGMLVASTEDTFILTACEHGHGKRTPIADYPVKGRGGQGVINIRTEGRNGNVIGLVLCKEQDDMMFITEQGMIVRSPVADSRPMGRNTQGVILVNLKEGDRLVGVELVSAEDVEAYARVQPQQRIAPPSPLETGSPDEETAEEEPADEGTDEPSEPEEEE